MTETFWTSVIVGCGTGATILIQLYRENRNRKWDEQDRIRIAAELAQKTQEHASAAAAALAAAVSRQAAAAEMMASARATHMLAKIKENTNVTQQAADQAQAAFTEANTVNRKIESIGLEMKDKAPLNPKEPEHE